jgi:hypothetical protein
MRPATRIRLVAASVFVAGIVVAAAGGTMAAWSWATPDVHPAFRIALPLATAWLLFTMVRLALALPGTLGDEDRPTDLHAAPQRAPGPEERDASFVQEIRLPGRIARRVVYADGRTRYRVGPAARRRPVVLRRVAAALGVALVVAGTVMLLESEAGGVEWLAWLGAD